MMPWSQRASHDLAVGLAVAFAMATSPGPSDAETGRGDVHEVNRGETLAIIAQRHGVTIDDLAAANGLNPEEPLSVGRSLKLPRPGAGHFHVVRSGETLAQIARNEHCEIDDLVEANELSASSRLSVGQVLELPRSGRSKGETKVSAAKGRTHTVKSGESLNEIAHAYGIGTKVLIRANKISNPKSVRTGTILQIPDLATIARSKEGARVAPIKRAFRVSGERQGRFVVHYVMDGQSWKTLAGAYKTTTAALQAANKGLGRKLHVGDGVRILTKLSPVAVRVANCGYPGIRFVRREKSQTIRLITCEGGVSGRGRRQLSALATSPGDTTSLLLHPQLLRRLQRVADEFPGRAFRVVSGYRAPRGERGASRHHVGKALDFSLSGVPNKALHAFCCKLPSTGCGFYPNSTFVHLDYRAESASWIDYSGPGEEPDYQPRQTPPEIRGDPAPPPPSSTNGNGA